jgi:hypothetical protein
MTTDLMTALIFAAGLGQASLLIASSLVPSRLHWREELQSLPRLHRQMHWVYGGYVLLSIIAFALLSTIYASELAAGGGLARGVCAYIAVFWAVRLGLQGVFELHDRLRPRQPRARQLIVPMDRAPDGRTRRHRARGQSRRDYVSCSRYSSNSTNDEDMLASVAFSVVVLPSSSIVMV